MEDRVLLATFTVTNPSEGGPGSLRQAILSANASPGLDQVRFNIVAGALTETPIPTPASQPGGIVTGSDGNLWFTEVSANKIGRISPTTGAFAEFPVPTASSQPTQIAAGSDGNLYFTEAGGAKIGRITTAGIITEIPTPSAGTGSFPYAITTGPDGNIWFTDFNRHAIERLNLSTLVITETAIPTAGAFAFGITSNPDGRLYFTEGPANQIGRIDARTLAIQEFAAPGFPEGITTGPDNNIWFTATMQPRTTPPIAPAINAIGRLDLTTPTPTVTEFPTPTVPSLPFDITTGPDGNLWFTDLAAGTVGRITTAGVITEFATSSPGSSPFNITRGPDGLLWFTERDANLIGRLTALPSTTVALASALPAVTDPVVIDGYTQPGAAPNTLAAGDNAVVPITLDGSNAGANADGLQLAPNSGGSTIQGLVIDRFGGAGLRINGSTGNQIAGNFLGTDRAGAVGLPNAIGIALNGAFVTAGGVSPAAGNTIGGATPASRNLIAGNLGPAINLADAGTTGNLVQGNFLGTSAAGTVGVPNGSGIVVAGGASANTIGGTGAGAGNLIAFNKGPAVFVLAGVGDAILGNAIVANAALGIDLAPAGVTPNTPGGPHAGPNLLQNFPVLNSAVAAGATTTITGTLNSTPNSTFRIELFASDTCDPSGFGQGQIFLGSTTVTTDGVGNGTFLFNAPAAVAFLGRFLSATATDLGNNTSEFSACVTVVGPTPPGFTVTNTNDSGPGSLRQAILNSEARGGGVTIDFRIPGVGPFVIRPASALPTITFPVAIDATTQPGFAGQPIVDLDGFAAGAGVDGLTILAGRSRVRGLAIHGFRSGGPAAAPGGNGIVLRGAGGDLIDGDFVGTDTTGTGGVGNAGLGVLVDGSPGNTIGGATAAARVVLANNGSAGVELIGPGASGNAILGDFVGTDFTGTRALGNGNIGVFLANAPGNTIGGSAAGAGNVISGNRALNPQPPTTDPSFVGAGGVVILGAGARGNVVANNRIGTDVTGTRALGNAFDGVTISGAPGNTIGGTAPGTRNVIAANNLGVRIFGAGAAGNVVQGNLIGTDIAGTAPLGNTTDGVFLDNAPGNTIGGTTPGARNVISASGQVGVQVFGAGASGNQIQGNFIGTDVAGAVALGNGFDGVFINNAPANTVGGTVPEARNLISGNGRFGIELDGPGAVGNLVAGNLIGLNATGTAVLGNAQGGIYFAGAPNNAVAGPMQPSPNIQVGNGVETLRVQGIRLIVRGQVVVGFLVTYNKDLNPVRAVIPADYLVRLPDRAGRFGPRSRVDGVRFASYDRATRTVSVFLFAGIGLGTPFQLTINAGASLGVADASGRLLDGGGTGQPGNNFVAILGPGTPTVPVAAVPGPPRRFHLSARAVDSLLTSGQLSGKAGRSKGLTPARP